MVGLKGMEEIPTDCKKCHLMGAKGNPTEPFSPMMCVAIWAIKHEVKYCIGGKIRDDCPLVEIITCKNCNNHVVGALDEEICLKGHELIHENFYCKDGERKK